jgi:ABC-type polysaccharide/polyol phosphate export permease
VAEWIDARPLTLVEALGRLPGFPARLWRQRELVAAWVRRDLRSRLLGTFLGRAWPLLAPLLLFGAYWFVFTRLLGFRLPGLAPGQTAALGVWMFLGVVVWTAFAESLTRCTHAILDNARLVARVQFPAELLPVEIVLAQLVTMSIALVLFVVVAPLAGVWRVPGAWLAAAPLVLLLQALFTAGLGLLLATLQVFVRDTAHVVGVGLTLWMFATPLFWVPAPEVLPGIEGWLGFVDANPMHHLLYVWRAGLMGLEPELCFGTSVPRSLALFAAWAVGSFALGHTAFVLGARRFPDEA